MTIGNNKPGSNNFGQNNYNKSNQQRTQTGNMANTFENRWNKVQEYNRDRKPQGNGFVRRLEEQKYSSAADTSGMHDRTLAMLQDRLEKGTISLEEFNKKCALLGTKRQNISKKNKLF